eukprot:GHVR01005264.1.p1 GENE.GHVR01005264.1~~GHVR01005264.1.p1  ORF type:complete len:339 (+),score=89.60 GHVR01005264.1:54-1019(+)
MIYYILLAFIIGFIEGGGLPCVVAPLGDVWLCITQQAVFQTPQERAGGATNLWGVCPSGYHILSGFSLGFGNKEKGNKAAFIESCPPRQSKCMPSVDRWADMIYLLCGQVKDAPVSGDYDNTLPELIPVLSNPPVNRLAVCPNPEEQTMAWGVSFALNEEGTSIDQVYACGGVGSNLKCPPSLEDLGKGNVYSIAYCAPRMSSFLKEFSVHVVNSISESNCKNDETNRCLPSAVCASNRTVLSGLMLKSDIQSLLMCPINPSTTICSIPPRIIKGGSTHTLMFMVCTPSVEASTGLVLPESEAARDETGGGDTQLGSTLKP